MPSHLQWHGARWVEERDCKGHKEALRTMKKFSVWIDSLWWVHRDVYTWWISSNLLFKHGLVWDSPGGPVVKTPCSQCRASPPHGAARGWGSARSERREQIIWKPRHNRELSISLAELGPEGMASANESSPCAWPWVAGFVSITSFGPHHSSHLSTCPSSQLVQGQAGIWTQAFWLQSPSSRGTWGSWGAGKPHSVKAAGVFLMARGHPSASSKVLMWSSL